ncbi:MAG: AmmeMemoRadiSam system radical SAM enzyme [archaeon]
MSEKQAELYKKEKNSIKCLACAHKCLINEDKAGICGVRKNISGKLVLLVYGKLVGVHVDPIEKKPIYGFLPGSKAYSIGTVGCNFKCDFCQNFDISQVIDGKIFGQDTSAEEVVEQALETGCKSIAYTYTEPIIAVEFYKEIMELAMKKGLKNIMVSNGYWSKESFDYIKDFVDAVNIDLKGNNEFYKKYCKAKLEPVKETIKRCAEFGIHVEVTTLVIPGLNDGLKDLEDIAKFLGSVDKNIIWHLSRFFPMYKMQNHKATPVSVLEEAKKIGEKYLRKIYIGNV